MKKKFFLSILLLIFSYVTVMANSYTYYAKMKADSPEPAKGLVYVGTTNSAPLENAYKNTITATGSGTSTSSSASVSFYVWAKPCRGYEFNGWTTSDATISGNVATMTSSAKSSSAAPTEKITANWKEKTKYTITYLKPENGYYSVEYSYLTSNGTSFVDGSDVYNLSVSSDNNEVISYEEDVITLSSSLNTFLGWYEIDSNGNETELSTSSTYTYSVTKNATIKAKFKAGSDYKASVTSNGNTTQYTTLSEAISVANGLNTNPTITLLDNVLDVTTKLSIKKSMTIDLNGKLIMSVATSSFYQLLDINASGINVTITDSSSERNGKMSIAGELNRHIYCVYVTKGTLNVEGGILHAENNANYASNTSERTSAVYIAAGQTLNMKGGTIDAYGDRYVYGVNTAGSSSSLTTVNVTGGNITASATNSSYGYAYGIYSYADVNISAGAINAYTTNSVGAYGVTLNAYSNVDVAKCYHATLTMSGGTITADAATSTAVGVYVGRAMTYNGQEVTSSHRAVANINGGVINANAVTSAYGINTYGDVELTGGSIKATTTSSSGNGVRVTDGNTTISGNADISATAASSAFGVYAASETTSDRGVKGEGNVVINGGKISSTTTTGGSSFGVYVHASSRQISSTATNYYPGYYAAAAHVVINDGSISAESATTTANAVYVMATSTLGTASATPTCTINGGKFKTSATGSCADVNALASTEDFKISNGVYTNIANINTYLVSDELTIYDIDTTSDLYKEGYRYYVSPYLDDIYVAQIGDVKYKTLEVALSVAKSGETVILINNYKLDAQVTIPTKVMLLIPYSADYKVLTTSPHMVSTGNTYEPIYAFKTLSLGENAAITVKSGGSICVAGQQQNGGFMSNTTTTGAAGCVTGGYGCLNMSTGGSITLESGSNLYAWGYIVGQNMNQGNNTTGVGTITAKSGSKVYDDFVIGDWRGGNATASLGKGKNASTYKVFPFSQYYLPNIEVPLTLEYGAENHAHANLFASNTGVTFDVPFIGTSSSFFTMKSGSVKKWYDPTTDRLHFEMDGDLSLEGLSLSVAGVDINSSDFVLPVTNNLDISIKKGSLTVPDDMAVLPGAIIEIGKDATANIQKNVYLYDLDQWDLYAYTGYYLSFEYRPTVHYSRTISDWKSKSFIQDSKLIINGLAEISGHIYTTSSGADISSSEAGMITLKTKPNDSSVTYQILEKGSVETPYSSTYSETVYLTQIPVVASLLHNEDDSYTKTAGTSAGVSYHYVNGYWLSDDIDITVYKPGQAEPISDKLNKWTEIQETTPNAIAEIDPTDNSINNYAEKLTNMVVDGVCPNFVVTDKKPVDVPFEFTATNAAYSRTNTKNSDDLQWGTICLPFAVTSDDAIQYYQLSELKDNIMTFTQVETVDANTPAIFSVSSDATSIDITSSNATIPVTSEGSVYAGGLTLHGILTATKVLEANANSTYYYIAKNKFWRPTTNNTNVAPQRAYFTSSTVAGAKMFDIAISENSEVTAVSSVFDSESSIEGIYNANGVKQNVVQKGVNIIRFSNGKTQKIMIK